MSRLPTPTTLPELARLLRGDRNVVFVTGAGLSVASGISPYRKAPGAVWETFVTEWGTMARFHEDTAAWWREFWLKAHGDALEGKKPNAGHDAITAIVRRSSERHTVITQNIDGLHRMSGVPDEQLIEIHGRHGLYRCADDDCAGARTPTTTADLSRLDEGIVPRCTVCGGKLRPLVLLFDEVYDSHPFFQMRRAKRLLNDVDVILFVGTSFSVGITDMALRAARYNDAVIVNINLDVIEVNGATVMNITGKAEEILPDLAAA